MRGIVSPRSRALVLVGLCAFEAGSRRFAARHAGGRTGRSLGQSALRELRVLALSSPALLQNGHDGFRQFLPILPISPARGSSTASAGRMRPDRRATGRVLAWTCAGETDSLAMALSMLGLRVRTFDGHEPPLAAADLFRLAELFDALVDPPFAADALSAAIAAGLKFFRSETRGSDKARPDLDWLPASRTVVLR